jgi:hypothetical protein
MTSHDAFDAWLESEAEEAIPEGELDRALALTAGRQPRPAPLARLGSHWVTGAPAGTGGVTRLALRPLWAVVALLLVLVLATVAVMVGSRAREQQVDSGLLVYQLGSAVYLAQADGTSPRQLTTRTGTRHIGSCALATGTSSIWAPDGEHFLCYGGSSANIFDTAGRLVGSFEGDIGGDATWSPDSQRVQAWMGSVEATSVGIYGVDGARTASLSVPDGYMRVTETGGAWASDSRSVVVQIRPSTGTAEAWRLSIDGSAPSRIADDDPLANPDVTFSRDGTRLAFTRAQGHESSLYLAKADGTEPVFVRTARATEPIWSPDGTYIAYVESIIGVPMPYRIRVLSLPSETDRELVPGLVYEGRPSVSWSASGNKLLLPKPDGRGRPSLWSVNADGTDPRLLIEGADVGAWQPPT